ncbi:MAG: hypothetical protein NVS1B4_16350 [Gemmatimonadaceae bacterium]
MTTLIPSSPRAALTVGALLLAATEPLKAQYPLAPTPVVAIRTLTREPKLSGYVSMRETVRADTATMIVNRARLTLQSLVAPYAAVRLQGDFSSIGRAVGDTVPAFVLTDAFVELTPEETPDATRSAPRTTLILGQFKTPFALEYLTPFTVLATANRSQAVERLAPRRDLGAMATVAVPRVGLLTAAVVNGGGPNRTGPVAKSQQLMGRLTVFPVATLAVSAKWLGQESDHRWGYDARWTDGRSLLEGEVVQRAGPIRAGVTTDAAGGYALAAYRVLPWLRPLVRWEQLREQVTTATAVRESSLTWMTWGVTLMGPQERIRAQLEWVTKSDQPVARRNEAIAQFQAIF